MNVKYVLRILSILLLAMLVTRASATADDHVKIGFILPLSGDWAFLGNGVRDAALLAEEDSRKRKYPVELFFEDNSGELKRSASAASKLISIDRVDAIISIISGVGLLLEPITDKAKVLNFGLCSNTAVANGRFSFVNYITAAEGAEAFLSELIRDRSTPVKFGIFSLNEAGFNQIVAEVVDKSKSKPVQLQFSESFEPGTKDFRSQIVKSLQQDTQTILLLGLSPDIEVFARQLRELGKSVSLSSIEAFGLAEDRAAFNGSWFVDAAAPSSEFEARFRATYGREITAAASHAYDTVQLIAEGFERGGNGSKMPSTTEVAMHLRSKRDFYGVVGRLSVDAQGIIHSVPSVKTIESGRALVRDLGNSK